jgi:beta-phosphoglucomutase-like phosphatase (HAD superfamily)
MAIVSSSHESQIRALLQAQFAEFLPHLNHVFGKESGRKTENDGFLHKKCLHALGLAPEEVLVIEDAPDGLKAALCAHLPTAVFYNEYTFGSDFAGAKLVAPGIHHFDLEALEAICMEG